MNCAAGVCAIFTWVHRIMHTRAALQVPFSIAFHHIVLVVRRWWFWLDWLVGGLLGSRLRHLMLELQAYKAIFCLFLEAWNLLIWTQLLTPEKHIHTELPLPFYSSCYRIQDALALKIHPITKGLAGSFRIPLSSAHLQSCTQQSDVLWVHSYPLWWA